jgi:hypothetical protein
MTASLVVARTPSETFRACVFGTNRLCEALGDAVKSRSLRAVELAPLAASRWLETRAAGGALLETLSWKSAYAASVRSVVDQLAHELQVLLNSARLAYDGSIYTRTFDIQALRVMTWSTGWHATRATAARRDSSR